MSGVRRVVDAVWGIRRSLQRSGIRGTARICAIHARRALGRGSAVAREAAREEREFDERYGVETRAERTLRGLSIVGESLEHGNRYGTILPREFRGLLDELGLDFTGYTYVDLGSGKGRTLMLAAERPFRAAIGVEFAKELHEAATENIRRFQRAAGAHIEMRSLNMDAGDFEVPAGPVLVYMYNPFDGVVMSRVAANIERSLRDAGRALVVLYVNPTAIEAFDRAPSLRVVRRERESVPPFAVLASAEAMAEMGSTGAVAAG